jgi:hypothetical protein
MIDEWHDVDDEILRPVQAHGIVSTAELAQKLGVSDQAAASFPGAARARRRDPDPGRRSGAWC